MAIEPNKEIIRRAVSALGHGDVAGFLAEAADDFTFTLAGTPPGSNTVQGKQPMIKLLRTAFARRLERGAVAMTIENLIAEGEYVVEQARGTARTLDGQDYNNTYCRVWRVVDGQILSLVEYLDTELARRCLWT